MDLSNISVVNFFRKKSSSVMLGLFSIFLVVYSALSFTESENSRKSLVAPPKGLQYFSFGYAEVWADLLWIRAVQDFDYCDESKAPGLCKDHSWLYHMLDVTTDLSPQFRIPYAAGALALTVIISDIDGATKIFDKGVKAFPNDWPILYRAAYHYMYEVKDNKRAAELLIQAGKNGAPPWVFTLAGRLYSDSGSVDLAEAVLRDMIETKQDPKLIQRLKDKIQSIKSRTKSS